MERHQRQKHCNPASSIDLYEKNFKSDFLEDSYFHSYISFSTIKKTSPCLFARVVNEVIFIYHIWLNLVGLAQQVAQWQIGKGKLWGLHTFVTKIVSFAISGSSTTPTPPFGAEMLQPWTTSPLKILWICQGHFIENTLFSGKIHVSVGQTPPPHPIPPHPNSNSSFCFLFLFFW